MKRGERQRDGVRERERAGERQADRQKYRERLGRLREGDRENFIYPESNDTDTHTGKIRTVKECKAWLCDTEGRERRNQGTRVNEIESIKVSN